MKTLIFCVAAAAVCCGSNAFCQPKIAEPEPPVMHFSGAVACIADANGVKRPQMQHSSGYRELDRAALDAAKIWCSSQRKSEWPKAIERKPDRTT